MGCLHSHTYSQIKNDPAVVAYATVGDVGVANGPQSTLYKKHWSRRALLYIQGEALYYFESRFCGCQSLTCKYPFTCITTTEVLRNEALIVQNEELFLHPGLQVTITGSNGLDTTLSAVMPDADHFAKKLTQSLDEYKALQR